MVSVELALRILSKKSGGDSFALLHFGESILWGENICGKPRDHSVLASCSPDGSW